MHIFGKTEFAFDYPKIDFIDQNRYGCGLDIDQIRFILDDLMV